MTVELPRGAAVQATLEQAAALIAARLARIFLRDQPAGGPSWARPLCSRPIRTGATTFRFYEYFHGDNGAGLGASHQTGWTALVAELIDWSHARSLAPATSTTAEQTQPHWNDVR